MTGRTVFCTAVIAGIGLGLAAAPPPKHTPVTSIVLDYAADVAPRLHVQSDGSGSYVPASNLVSQIQTIGDWELDAKNPKNAVRKIYLDFTEPIPGSAPGGVDPTPLPSGQYKFRIIAKCSLYGNSLLAFTAGQVKTCPLHIGFDVNGATWSLQMNPVTGVDVAPETNYATVTCIFPTSGTSLCSQWRFTPSGTYTAPDGTTKNRNVARLEEHSSGRGGQITRIHRGNYYVSFSTLIVK